MVIRGELTEEQKEILKELISEEIQYLKDALWNKDITKEEYIRKKELLENIKSILEEEE